jgi:predicted phage replisome organizer
MADVKWIKITTDIFDDEKILLIESMPSADSIIVIWFKLLAFAGKQNNDGVFLMSNRIAYTDEMLASIFRRDVKVIRLALDTFVAFGMIEIVDNVITIPNWNKHQTLDAYEKKKERDRLYQAERRASQRALIKKSSDKSSDVAISDIDIEKDIDKEKEKNISNICSTAEKSAIKQKPSAIDLTLNTGELYGIDEDSVKEWEEIYPAVDVMQELRNMKGWLLANPTKRKTKSGIKRFINNWLAKEQNKGGNNDKFQRDANSNGTQGEWKSSHGLYL